MKTTENAKQQGWVDGRSYLLVVRHFYATDELIGKFDSAADANTAADELDEVAKAMSIVVGPDGDLCFE